MLLLQSNRKAVQLGLIVTLLFSGFGQAPIGTSPAVEIMKQDREMPSAVGFAVDGTLSLATAAAAQGGLA